MPIKEIITFGLGVIGTLLVLHGPLYPNEAMRNMEIQIAREVVRTDNWGNPDIFAGHHERIHAAGRLSPIRHPPR